MLLMSFRYRVQSKLLDVATVEYHKCSKPNQIVFDFALGWNAADAFETVLLFHVNKI